MEGASKEGIGGFVTGMGRGLVGYVSGKWKLSFLGVYGTKENECLQSGDQTCSWHV